MSETKTKAKEAPAEPADVQAFHPELGERSFPASVWESLKDEKGNRAGWETKPSKPTELK